MEEDDWPRMLELWMLGVVSWWLWDDPLQRLIEQDHAAATLSHTQSCFSQHRHSYRDSGTRVGPEWDQPDPSPSATS